MIKKTTTYTDFNGVTRTEDFYFNITEAELVEMEVGVEGGMRNLLEKIIRENDKKMIYEYLKKIVLTAYGEKSADGRRFVKSEELRNGFAPTEACSNIILDLCNGDNAASDFIKGVLPSKLSSQVEASANAELANN